MRFGSVCSGIEAASAAWRGFGWEAAWFSEIEPFPSAVLAHHYPDVPNLGDMTTLPARILAGEVEAPDILVGGTPCQSFSVAGLRQGLADPRGQLTRTYVEILDALDAVRSVPALCVWENVPGVLSDKGNAFGNFLGALCGEDAALEPPGGKWTNAGLVLGPTRQVAWRVLDAQYFGVAQRRRRVFVVAGSPACRIRPSQVLLVEHGVSRHSPPSREAREVAPTIPSRSTGGGGLGTDFGLDEGVITHTLRGEGFDASEDGTGRGTPLVPVAFQSNQSFDSGDNVDIAPTLRVAGGGAPPAIAFSAKDYGGDAMDDCSPTLRAGAHSGSHANGGAMPAVAFDLRGREGGAMPEGPHNTANIRAASGGSSRSYVAHPWAVRRLTPLECERLQGFPDGWTDVPYRNKRAADGPRYKALGNSMAVPVMRWIGSRIAEQVQK